MEGLASHTGPESCAVFREERGEALTGGVQAGTLSREITIVGGADAVRTCGRQHVEGRQGKALNDPTRSETPRMYASASHGNREIPRLASKGNEVRAVNPKGARR